MRLRDRTTIALLLILTPVLAFPQKKKHSDVPAAFQNAHFLYVEAEDGDALRPGLFPADRKAIFDVQNGLRDWNRYALANRREQADLILVVRKGRIASGQVRTGISSESRPNGTQSRNPGQPGGDPDNIGAVTELGPEFDTLRVYLMSSDGKRSGPVWSRELRDGLDAPGVILLAQLRAAVEHAYPSQPPAKQPTP
jgi:hypothetical protein